MVRHTWKSYHEAEKKSRHHHICTWKQPTRLLSSQVK